MRQREADVKGGRRQKKAMDEIEADFANIRAAWRWTVRQGDMPSVGSMLEALSLFCQLRSRQLAGVELYQQNEAEKILAAARQSGDRGVRLRRQLEADLPPQLFAAAWERGKAMELTDVTS